jgi:ABC-2 type transport system ATP-binding protein
MLELHDITKRYGERLALDAVSFTVGDGRLTGFVGGKRRRQDHHDADHPRRARGRRRLGDPRRRPRSPTPTAVVSATCPRSRGLYPKMRLLEQTVYLARLHGWTPAAARRNALELLERLGLGERTEDTIESLSLGNQQRAQIAAALVHRPEVLVLDEPFSGLDRWPSRRCRACCRMSRHPVRPCCFSSHQLDIVERSATTS